jgi:hypothetical protein
MAARAIFMCAGELLLAAAHGEHRAGHSPAVLDLGVDSPSSPLSSSAFSSSNHGSSAAPALFLAGALSLFLLDLIWVIYLRSDGPDTLMPLRGSFC